MICSAAGREQRCSISFAGPQRRDSVTKSWTTEKRKSWFLMFLSICRWHQCPPCMDSTGQEMRHCRTPPLLPSVRPTKAHRDISSIMRVPFGVFEIHAAMNLRSLSLLSLLAYPSTRRLVAAVLFGASHPSVRYILTSGPLLLFQPLDGHFQLSCPYPTAPYTVFHD